MEEHKMKIICFLKKILLNCKLDLDFIFKLDSVISKKIKYLFDKYKNIILNKKNITYLDNKKFYYDNRFTPALLQSYPFEIQQLDNKIKFNKINKILDVGANIGQFARTILYYYPNMQIYSFEPNMKIFSILRKNKEEYQNWKIFPYAITNKNEDIDFYFVKNKSSQGSIYKQNAKINLINSNNLVKLKIKSISLCKDFIEENNFPIYFDLVKIDVEGAEISVIKALKNISFKYLYVELSLKREGKASIKEVIEILKKYNNKKIKFQILKKDSITKTVLFWLL